MNNANKFKSGDKVFAKVKGHSNWPAVINSVEVNSKIVKYNVTFYGTNEVACVKEIDVCSYLENKSRFGSSQTRNKKLTAALKEIEKSFIKNTPSENNSTISKVGLANNSDLQKLTASTEIMDVAFVTSSPLHLVPFSNSSMTVSDVTHDKENKSTPGENSPTMEKDVTENQEDKSPLAENNKISMSYTTNDSYLQTPTSLLEISDVSLVSGSPVNLIQNSPTTGRDVSENNKNIPLSLLESKWVTDDTVQIVFDILNDFVPHTDLHFVNPVVTLTIKTLSDLKSILMPHSLEQKKFVFFPVNDSSEIQKLGGSGTHWSLLLWDVYHSVLYHFDSLGTYNIHHAQLISEKLNAFYSSSTPIDLLNVKSPRQTNSVDCGIYMLLTAEFVASRIANGVTSITLESLE